MRRRHVLAIPQWWPLHLSDDLEAATQAANRKRCRMAITAVLAIGLMAAALPATSRAAGRSGAVHHRAAGARVV